MYNARMILFPTSILFEDHYCSRQAGSRSGEVPCDIKFRTILVRKTFSSRVWWHHSPLGSRCQLTLIRKSFIALAVTQIRLSEQSDCSKALEQKRRCVSHRLKARFLPWKASSDRLDSNLTWNFLSKWCLRKFHKIWKKEEITVSNQLK